MGSPRIRLGRRLVTLVGLVALLGAGGCATVPMAPAGADQQAKEFSPPAHLARIYLYRDQTFGGAITMAVSLDGKPMGRTAPKTFFVWDVRPGRHTVTSNTENTATLTLDARAGHAYYIWQQVKMGVFSPRSALHEVDERTGREGVMACHLAQSQPGSGS